MSCKTSVMAFEDVVKPILVGVLILAKEMGSDIFFPSKWCKLGKRKGVPDLWGYILEVVVGYCTSFVYTLTQ
jgi:hypothetical protein